jgi:hypothetical protein
MLWLRSQFKRVGHQQLHARMNGQGVLITVCREWSARDILEREIRLAVVGESGVQELRDVGMIQPGEDLPFAGHTP